MNNPSPAALRAAAKCASDMSCPDQKSRDYWTDNFARKIDREFDGLTETLRQVRSEIAPLSAQIICPKDNVFSRLIKQCDEALAAFEKGGRE